jgi:hypothetical protein
MRRFAGTLLLLAIVCASAGRAETPDEHVWELNSYLRGTTAEVRELLNGEVERFLALQSDRQRKVEEQTHFVENTERAVLAEVHATDAYRARLQDRDAAEQSMQALAAGNDLTARMSASSRFNKARLAMEGMEKQAMRNDPVLIRARVDLVNRQNDLNRIEPALATAQAWRDELLSALRDTYRLRYPLRVGDVGTLGCVTPDEITVPDSLVIVYTASEFMELVQDARQGEGIKTYSVLNHLVRMEVRGIDTSEIKPGEETFLDRTFRVDAVRFTREHGMTCTVSRTDATDEDRLFEAVVPLRKRNDGQQSILSK